MMSYPFLVGLAFSVVTVTSQSIARQAELSELDRGLQEAVITGTLSEVQQGIMAGGNARLVDRYGTTLLMHAAVRGKSRVVESLLLGGADPEARNEEDETALFFAARGCSEPSVKLLLKRRVEVNLRNQSGETALMIAAENGCVPVVRTLLQVPRIDLFAQDEWGRTALRYMDVNWINGLDMESLELARAAILHEKQVAKGKAGASPLTTSPPVRLP